MTERIYGGEYGIRTANELADELVKYKLSFNLCCQSFRTEVQNAMVGRSWYTPLRNKAMEVLAEAGFNKENPTRLCLANAPVTRQNIDDAFGIYVFARERNMYPVIVVPMTSGKQLTPEFIEKVDITKEQKVKLWVDVYSWNIEHGVQTMEQLRQDGISCIAGGHVCNQNAAGIYITANGNVVRCPGFTDVLGNVRDESIKDIWERIGGEYAGEFNCHCPPKDDITIPPRFYETVLEILEKIYG
jgi:MoaA/NifB/PqqE/SkfB family radical SAM enzyme